MGNVQRRARRLYVQAPHVSLILGMEFLTLNVHGEHGGSRQEAVLTQEAWGGPRARASPLHTGTVEAAHPRTTLGVAWVWAECKEVTGKRKLWRSNP